MNRIQQQAIAETLGMQASELGDALYKQQLIDKTAQGFTKKLREQADLTEKRGNSLEAIRLRDRAAAIEQGILQGKSLEESKAQVDTQQKFNLALERAKEIFTDLIDGGLLDGLVSTLEDIVISLERLGYGNREARLASEMQKAIETQKSQGKSLNEESFAELQAVASTTPTLLGKIFGIGGAFKKDSFDYVTKEEREAAQSRIKELSTINANDFTIRTHPKDELVIAGGTNLSGGSNQEMVSLLKELVTAAKQGQNVTVAVDGNNIFKAMNTSKYMS